MKRWLKILETVGLAALSQTPLAPLAPIVVHAISEAEAIPGATGQEKLTHVENIVVDAAQGAQNAGAKVDAKEVRSAAEEAISTAIAVTNIVHKAKTPPQTS